MTAFTLNAHVSGVPVNVLELESCHFARSESQSREQQQNRVVAATYWSTTIDGGKQLAHSIRRNRTGNRRHRPVGDGGNSGGQVKRDVPTIACIAQE